MNKHRRTYYLAFPVAMVLFATASAFADEAAIDAKLDRLERQVQSQAEELKALKASSSQANQSNGSDTTVGGYGEINYNAYQNHPDRNQMDLRRLVLFVGHRFSDRWTFTSEIEWEHAVTSAGDEGETAIEQAYLNYQFTPGTNLKTGLFLMPFGFINEHHEPPVYYGVERNEVETRIIPTTWREGGVGLSGTTQFGLRTEVGITTGFDIAKFDDEGAPLSSVHQELQLAKAHDLSYYGALNYDGVPGFNIGGAVFTGNSGQGNAHFKADDTNPDFADIDARVTLWETHTRFQKNGLDLEALYAEGTIGEADKIDSILEDYNTANSADRAMVPEKFNGWLLQGAYTVWHRGDMSLTPFVRWEQFDTQAEMPSGLPSDPVNADRVTTFGFSFKPLTQIVFKSDYQSYKVNHDSDRFNLGMGYMF